MKKMKVAFSMPDISEEEIKEVIDTLKSGWITTGPKTKILEKRLAEFCHVNKMICLNSATASLEMVLRLLGIGVGDEVITTAYTFTATASPVYHVGAKVVLVDTAPNSYEMDYENLEKAITEKTKAIIPVDLGGIICDYKKVFDIVEKKKHIFKPNGDFQKKLGRIAVIADSAHGLGAEREGKRSGEIADFTSFSFHAVKNFTTAEGGAVAWKNIEGIDDATVYQELRLRSLHGQSKDALEKMQLGEWEYDIVAPYYKCNMTDIMAALGIAQLKRYPYLLKRRKEIINRYNEGIKGLPIRTMEHYGSDFSSSGHLYCIRIEGGTRKICNSIMDKMAEYGVATNVHYKPLPMLTAYKKKGFDIDNFPNAYRMYENEITLPLHTKLSNDEVDYVVQILKKVVQDIKV